MKHQLIPKWLVVVIIIASTFALFALLIRITRSFTTPRGLRTTSFLQSTNGKTTMEREGMPLMNLTKDTEVGMIADEAMPYRGMPDIMPPMPMPGGSAATDQDGKPIDQRIVKNGTLVLQVEDAMLAMNSITTAVQATNGFVETSSISDNGEGPRRADMTLRVPVTQFETLLQQIKSSSKLVLHESTTGQDVTSEFIDLESNLRNAKAEEASYLSILERSGSIEEVLMVTKQLADVRGRIEQLEGRKRYMENRTDLATIYVSCTEETRIQVPSKTWNPGEVYHRAVQNLIVSLQGLIDFLIQFVIAVIGLLLPIILIATLIVWLCWKFITFFIKKKSTK